MIGVEIKELQTINLVVYRPPDTKRNEFKVIIDSLKSILNENDNQKYTIILSGDFNFRFVEWNRNQSRACSYRYKQGTSKDEKDQFLDLIKVCDDHCLVQIIEEPTRGENTLDLIFTNEVSLINDIEVNKSNKSDHCRVEISTNFILKEENDRYAICIHTPPEALFGFRKKTEETKMNSCTGKVCRLQK